MFYSNKKREYKPPEKGCFHPFFPSLLVLSL